VGAQVAGDTYTPLQQYSAAANTSHVLLHASVASGAAPHLEHSVPKPQSAVAHAKGPESAAVVAQSLRAQLRPDHDRKPDVGRKI